MYTLQPPVVLQELTMVANFCEVYLAKEGHGGVVGINLGLLLGHGCGVAGDHLPLRPVRRPDLQQDQQHG